ncbi:MAG TPA: ADP-ribosylglycohydrolase family protein [Methylomusa anaerophila]|uniref:ADP-ribosylglycohydrolase n=1 Tax=Methylomusa anaerophila TaxID=1930071 RepID=A0A348AFS6_9FIRM|nr:ADP-ribosylglycohydrolase family protein [Methylomusa anaerophila]BBB89924.1 ADP-ribosylglycohydrolase [Methylomusa anaerophila]HML88350.1 ADP-ribosylglycohydrolase family protein [Methylomusa anaerophila]
MLGAIAGDIIGSVYEWNNIKTKDFPLFSDQCRFTDDTVLTAAVADSYMNGIRYSDSFVRYYTLYPHAAYGQGFRNWVTQAGGGKQPYSSWGNGSAMRVSPVGFAAATLEEALLEAERSAAVTHNHPDGIAGAQATAAAIFLSRNGYSREDIKNYIAGRFNYDLSRSLAEIRPGYQFDVSCPGSVPEAIIAFLESTDYEDAVRNAVSLGGDSDTIACIAGGIAQAYYGRIPRQIREKALALLDDRLRNVVLSFEKKYMTVN